jgi:hypothetical protein
MCLLCETTPAAQRWGDFCTRECACEWATANAAPLMKALHDATRQGAYFEVDGKEALRVFMAAGGSTWARNQKGSGT